MESFTFTTKNGNCYLYSPNKKTALPVPAWLCDELTATDVVEHSQLFTQLKNKGYLDECYQDLSGRITGHDVATALANLSQVVFEMTTRCNLRCEYCCYGDGYTTFENRKDGTLSFATAKAVIDFLVQLFSNQEKSSIDDQPFAISFYGGEPLLNFEVLNEIVEYAEMCSFQNRKLSFTMTTNAVLLAKYADFLSAHHFRILVSLDGNRNSDSYRKTAAGRESFDLVYQSLKTVQSKYPELFKSIRFNSVYTDRSDARDIIHFFRSEFGKVPQFSVLHEPDSEEAKNAGKIRAMQKPLDIPEDLNKDDDLILQNPIHKRIAELCIKSGSYCFYDESELLDDTDGKRKNPSGSCIPFSKRLFVSAFGTFHPCEKVNRDHPLGGVDKDNHISIDCNAIAARFNKMLDQQEKICRNCYLQGSCTICAVQTAATCHKVIRKEQFAKECAKAYSYIEENPNIVKQLDENIIIR